jgi:hypothetical protein
VSPGLDRFKKGILSNLYSTFNKTVPDATTDAHRKLYGGLDKRLIRDHLGMAGPITGSANFLSRLQLSPLNINYIIPDKYSFSVPAMAGWGHESRPNFSYFRVDTNSRGDLFIAAF